ncbi:hypothetical protein BH24ACT6_BH24ACT6_19270 [soil metagenome]
MGTLLVITGSHGAGKSTAARVMAEAAECSVLVAGDAFFGFPASGAIEPWLPESNEQNQVVTRDGLRRLTLRRWRLHGDLRRRRRTLALPTTYSAGLIAPFSLLMKATSPYVLSTQLAASASASAPRERLTSSTL